MTRTSDAVEQALVADSVERFLARSSGPAPAAVRPPDPKRWRAMAELGWIWPPADELVVPRPTQIALVAEGLGRHGVVEPYVVNAVACASILEASGGPAAARVLQGLRSGDREAALALSDAAQPGAPAGLVYDPQVGRLHGSCAGVVNGPRATDLLLQATDARTASTVLVLVPAAAGGLTLEARRTTDGLPVADLSCDGTRVEPAQCLSQGPAARDTLHEALDLAAFASCATVVGIMRDVVARTLDHLKARRQFGQPIGAFQALQHRAVDMHIATEEADALLHASVRLLGVAFAEKRRVAVAVLKNKCARAGRLVGQGGLQLHGAIAMTDELRIGPAWIRIEAELARWGSPPEHGARLQRALLDAAAEGHG